MAYQTVDPYTNKLVKTYPAATDADLEDALAQGHRVYTDWRRQAPAARGPILHKVAQLLREKKHDYAAIMTRDMGKLIGEAEAEVELCATIADYFADHGEAFMAPQPLTSSHGKAYYIRQATGVLVAVEPWNFPFYQVMRVFAPNFMVGNPMILKHASNTPGSAAAFEDMVREAGAPEGAFKNLFLSYDQVSQAIADPRVSGVALTGSERGGASVAQEAGKQLKKSSMELGGTDVFIALEDADWDAVYQAAPNARLRNVGQVCTSSKRFIIPASHYDEFVAQLAAAFKTYQPGDPMDPATTLAPMNSERAKEKVQSQIDEAIAHGAHVAYGNQPIDLPGAFIQPTILTDIDKQNPLFSQEIFGPVAEVFKVTNDDEAIALANDSRYGLGSVVYSQDPAHADAIARRIETGMTTINAPFITSPELPFGGVKNSGYGREMDEIGFATFTNEHMILNTSVK
ncbi:NAD-dependent succinate-semialdehyde dehydrogenase [Schleiferilactobacillus shenzhenensis]|uniref:SsdA n=1 Tax=Schleiferilactobacillus shenzhenensis LY-73 TaxID=1231336 RepID=U4TXA9_9LACO|nr:NAD-dependent succinate-semialdehyde dehydrogenase [Schleiferilactobacillus shenzhenensis]ERL65982.1 SsdA [Schleiferilactobacillus shenzhenensis LY-73]